MFLTNNQIKELTGKHTHRAQRTVLNALGLTHKVRPDGTLVVAARHVEKVLGVTYGGMEAKRPELNMDHING